MECSEPGAIRDEELLAYIDGTQVRPAVLTHLTRCQRCQLRLVDYQRMDRKLIQRLYRWDCPTSQTLGEYQMGLLSARQATEVQAHLQRCALCAAETVVLINFMANDLMLVELAGPSPAVTATQATNHSHNSHSLRNVKKMIQKWHTEGVASAQRIVATLLAPQPSFQRGVKAPWPRRYAAEGFIISIQVERTSQRAHQRGSLQLSGLVTCDGKALQELQGTSVLLSSATKEGAERAQSLHTQTIDELGNFLFLALEPDTYMLELQLSKERTIAIEDLSLTL